MVDGWGGAGCCCGDGSSGCEAGAFGAAAFVAKRFAWTGIGGLDERVSVNDPLCVSPTAVMESIAFVPIGWVDGLAAGEAEVDCDAAGDRASSAAFTSAMNVLRDSAFPQDPRLVPVALAMLPRLGGTFESTSARAASGFCAAMAASAGGPKLGGGAEFVGRARYHRGAVNAAEEGVGSLA